MKDSDLLFVINKKRFHYTYNYSDNIYQRIQLNLSSTLSGQFSNEKYINEFISWLVKHIPISTEIEERIIQLNMPMLYFVFIIKSYVFPDFSITNINNKKYKNKIDSMLSNFIQSYNDNYEYYLLDIARYIEIYDIIENDNFCND